MTAGSDRIRRILADHGSGLKRASEVPDPPPKAPPSPAVSPASGASPSASEILRARLAALRAQAGRAARTRGASPWDAEAGPVPELPAEDGRTLEERVGGDVRRGRYGSFLQVERRWPLASRHGSADLRDALRAPIPLRQRERRGQGRTAVDLREAVFVDIETTGLSGGTGTIAFLVGVGRFEPDAFVVRQYFVRDFPDEPAVLDALSSDLGDAPWVTFNGRSFDAPLLSTRFSLHRIPLADRDHLDLLPPSRRLWAGSLESHALSEIERSVLRVARSDDLPGALVPAAYFAWLRESRSAGVAAAFRHNEWDIVSLAALAGVVGRLLEDPASRPTAPARDHLDTARLLVDHGDLAKARACLEAAVQGGVEEDGRPSMGRLLGTLHRRAGDLDAAEKTWRRWIESWIEGDSSSAGSSAAGSSPARFDAHPYEEIAKLYEHRRKDAKTALVWVERALKRCPAADPCREDLLHRAERLRRRLG